jgi:hypothetical protein
MPRPNWIVDVEIAVLRVSLLVASILMNVVFALLGWELGRVSVNFIVAMFSTNDVFNDGLLLMAVALTVDLSVEHLLLLFTIFQTFTYQNQESQKYLEDYTTMVNSTQPMYL